MVLINLKKSSKRLIELGISLDRPLIEKYYFKKVLFKF